MSEKQFDPWASFVAMQGELTNPPKTKTVSTGRFSYAYADLAEVTDHVRPVMAKHGFAFSQGPQVDPTLGPIFVTRLYHRTGIFSTVEEKMPDFRDQKEKGAYQTYTKRYQLLGILGLTGDDDTDGEPIAATERRETRPAAPPRPDVTKGNTQPAATKENATQGKPERPAYILALIDSAKAAKLKKSDLEQLISLRYPDVPSVDALDQAQCKTLVSDILKLER